MDKININRNIQVDLLKFLFCTGIIIYHYCILFCNNNVNLLPLICIRGVAHYGWLGVDFFYLSSGFYLHYAYRNKIEKTTFTDFFRRRLKAIYPMYLCVVILTLGLYFIDFLFFSNLMYHAKVNFWKILTSVFCVGTGWFDGAASPYGMGMYFVNILLLCYIIYYLILKKTANNHLLIIFILLAIIGFICVNLSKDIPFFYSRNGRGYMSFAIGIILCEIINYRAWGGAKERIAYILMLVLFALISCIMLFGVETTLGNPWKAFAVFIAPALFYIAVSVSWISHLFVFLSSKCNLLNKIGHYSMSLYFSASVTLVAIKGIAPKIGIHDFYSKKFFFTVMTVVFAVGFLWDIIFVRIGLNNKEKKVFINEKIIN